jgi:hypothetical protein
MPTVKNNLNSELLLKALENDDNESLMNLTNKKIKEINISILKELQLPQDVMRDYIKKLNGYRYIDEVKDIKYGGFIKWIPIQDPSYLPLNSGGIISEIKITNDGLILVYKNFMHKYYQIKMDECLIFQKLSNQEQVLLSALDHLEKS